MPHGIQRALIVDDQFINRTILERQLAPCGIDVTLCRSGADALATLAADSTYDVVITDHLMPDMDGLALAKAIRANHSTLPIVLLSSAIIPDLDRAVVNTVLQKPILRAELYRRLHGLTLNAAPAPAPPVPAPPVVQRQMRVLTAEDNRTNQLVFRKMVQDLPIDLSFANNGVEAVELFKSLQPDLIFMDISMPEMDGRDAARAIRLAEGGSATRVPIIALTAHSMDGDAENILAAGIDEYMTKPLRKTAITAALAAHCPPGAQPITDDQAAAS